MLSNTATPIYYGQFRDSVLAGEIPVNEEMSLQMNRIDELIENPDYYYDDEAINGFVEYCESELTLTNGEELVLLDSFKLWSEDLLSWFYFVDQEIYDPEFGRYITIEVKKRLHNKQYLVVARGSAKSMYASCLQSYFLNVDTDTTTQYVIAPTMDQAEEIMGPIRTSITISRGPLFRFLTDGSVHNTKGGRLIRQKLASTKKGIENFLTGSIVKVRPMSIAKVQGGRPKLTTIDEWLSVDIKEDIVAAIEQGGAKEQSATEVNDYAIVAISSEGTNRDGVGDSIKLELMDILRGNYYDPHTSIFWYKLDSVDEVKDPRMWPKANPNIGKTVTYETYQKDVLRAENNPSARNDILAKRFGIPMEGSTYYFTYEETLPTISQGKEFWGMQCSLGIDLSRGDDFCAFTFLFPLVDGTFGVKTRAYITSNTLRKLPTALRIKYQEFIDEGSLYIFEGAILDLMDVYEDLDNYIQECKYDVSSVGFDPYNARGFIERWTTENGPFGVVKVIQGAKTESVPLGEIKILAGEKALLFDQKMMTFTMGNAIVSEDTNGNRKLLKKRYSEKIDSVSALMDALVAYKENKQNYE
jgi:phage terminase large subunit-like protein